MSIAFESAPGIVAAAIALGASVVDVRCRRIPNVLTFGAAAVGFVFHTATGGVAGAAVSAAGWAVGALLFLPFFALGGMGAGDVKLVACLGAWLGPGTVLWAALFAAIAGGIMAAVVAFWRGYLLKAFSNLWWLFGYWRVTGPRPLPELTIAEGKGPRLAYAIPIAAGTMVALWLR